MDFSSIFNQFGNNPFSFEEQNYLYESNKPITKGEFINYLGLNYICQADVQVGSKILLVKDGLLAIPETLQPPNKGNDRVVLDRRVRGEDLQAAIRIPYLWGVTFPTPNTPYTTEYPNKRGERPLNTKLKGAVVDEDIDNWFIWVNTKNEVYTIGFKTSTNQPTVAVHSIKGILQGQPSFTGRVLDLTNLSTSSFSNSWFWAPSNPEINFENTVNSEDISIFDKGITFLLEDSQSDKPIKYSSLTNFAENLLGTRSTRCDWIAQVCLFPGKLENISHKAQYYWNFQNIPALPNTPERAIRLVDSRNIETTYIKPKLVDTENNRAITYEALNYKSNYLVHSNNVGSNLCTEYEISYDELGAFYYDYEENTRTPINSFGPYHLPLMSPGTSGVKAEYSEGDVITCNYAANTIYQGFPSDFGHYKKESNGDFFIKCEPEPWSGLPEPDSERGSTCTNGDVGCQDGNPPTIDGPGQSKGSQYWITVDFKVTELEGSFAGREDFRGLTKTKFSDGSNIYGPISAPTITTETVGGRTTDRLRFTAYKSQSDGENEANPEDLYLDPFTINSFTFGEIQQSIDILSFDRVRYTSAGSFTDIPQSEKEYVCGDGQAPTCVVPECGSYPGNIYEVTAVFSGIGTKASSGQTYPFSKTLTERYHGPIGGITQQVSEGGSSGLALQGTQRLSCRGYATNPNPASGSYTTTTALGDDLYPSSSFSFPELRFSRGDSLTLSGSITSVVPVPINEFDEPFACETPECFPPNPGGVGQCDGVKYVVQSTFDYEWHYPFNDPSLIETTIGASGGGFYWGPVSVGEGGVYPDPHTSHDPRSTAVAAYVTSRGYADFNSPNPPAGAVTTQLGLYRNPNVTITRVFNFTYTITRLDGQPDTCPALEPPDCTLPGESCPECRPPGEPNPDCERTISKEGAVTGLYTLQGFRDNGEYFDDGDFYVNPYSGQFGSILIRVGPITDISIEIITDPSQFGFSGYDSGDWFALTGRIQTFNADTLVPNPGPFPKVPFHIINSPQFYKPYNPNATKELLYFGANLNWVENPDGGIRYSPIPETCPQPLPPDNPGGNPNHPNNPPEIPNPYINHVRQPSLDNHTQESSIPFDAWGFIPNSSGDMVAVKGKVTNLSFTNSDKASYVESTKILSDDPLYIPLVKLRFFSSLSFRIEKAYGVIRNGDPLYERLGGQVSNSKGYLIYGKGIGSCGSNVFDNPESALMNMPCRMDKLYNEDLPYTLENTGKYRYVWEKSKKDGEDIDELWVYPADLSFVTEEHSKLPIPRFKFVLESGIYNLEFQQFDEIDLKGEVFPKDLSFHMNDKGLRRPRIRARN